jgi:hypothetical protein
VQFEAELVDAQALSISTKFLPIRDQHFVPLIAQDRLGLGRPARPHPIGIGVARAARHHDHPLDPDQDNLLLYEDFDGDNGAGIGANHQTGWTRVIAALIEMFGKVGV